MINHVLRRETWMKTKTAQGQSRKGAIGDVLRTEWTANTNILVDESENLPTGPISLSTESFQRCGRLNVSPTTSEQAFPACLR